MAGRDSKTKGVTGRLVCENCDVGARKQELNTSVPQTGFEVLDFLLSSGH